MKMKLNLTLLFAMIFTATAFASEARIWLQTPQQGWYSDANILYCSSPAQTQFTFGVSYRACPGPNQVCPPWELDHQLIVRIKRNGNVISQTQILAGPNVGTDNNGNFYPAATPYALPPVAALPGVYTLTVQSFTLTGALIWVECETQTSQSINSITQATGSPAISNFNLWVDNQIVAQTTPAQTSIPDVCLTHVYGAAIDASGSSGTISNYFYEVSEVTSAGVYVPGGAYSSSWYSGTDGPSWFGVASHASGVNFQANKYYKIKFAVQGGCTNWNEKSVIFHTLPDLSGRFTLYNPTNSWAAQAPSVGFNGWKAFFCSGGSTQIKISNTTTPASVVTNYRLHFSEYNPNTMQVIPGTVKTALLPPNYFDVPDRTLQSILTLMQVTLQSNHYYRVRLEAFGTCKYDGGGELWFATFGTCKTDESEDITGIEDVEETSDISIFPNPTNSMLNITTAIDGDVSFNVYDLNGRLALNGSFNKSSVLDVSALAGGVYQVELTTNAGNRIYKKFVKQ